MMLNFVKPAINGGKTADGTTTNGGLPLTFCKPLFRIDQVKGGRSWESVYIYTHICWVNIRYNDKGNYCMFVLEGRCYSCRSIMFKRERDEKERERDEKYINIKWKYIDKVMRR